MLRFDGEYPAAHPKAKFWSFLVKNGKKLAVKHSIEKPILLNLVNLSATFCPILYVGSATTKSLLDDCYWIRHINNNYSLFKGCVHYIFATTMVMILWEFLMFTKFSFHHNWNEAWILVTNRYIRVAERFKT